MFERIGAGHLGLGHREGRADVALEQRGKPALLDRFGGVEVEDLHVAGVGRGAVEASEANGTLPSCSEIGA